MTKELPKSIDHKLERNKDVEAIVNSQHHRKVVVAGPGTGKSFLFETIIKKAKKQGKKRFLAITFIGKLGDALADDLAGLAETMTLHGFARQLVLSNWKRSDYYPRIKDIIAEDLAVMGIPCCVGDDQYKKRTEKYKVVGDDDVVHYATQLCVKHSKQLPEFDLVLIDEFQDFNETESTFIDLLATKNHILIVGDDDQALYEFKGSSPKFIREKHDTANADYESHTLRFCSRCTEPIIGAFHSVVDHFGLNSNGSVRIQKQYLCYLPDKKEDSDANPKILLSRNTEVGRSPYLIRDELSKLLDEQKIKSVLVIGEAQTCASQLSSVARKLRNFGFKYVDHKPTEGRMFSFRQSVVDAYKMLAKDPDSPLGWRILTALLSGDEKKRLIQDDFEGKTLISAAVPNDFKKHHLKQATVMKKIIDGTPSSVKAIADSTIEKLMVEVVDGESKRRDLFTSQIASVNHNLARPLGNLDITVCSILGSKGLGADVVFLIGFDQGKLPAKPKVMEAEIYQLLVALTRAKKRIYLVNTVDCKMSQFISAIDPKYYSDM